MHRWALVAVAGLRARNVPQAARYQRCRREDLRQVGEDGAGLGQYATVGDQRKHAALGIERQLIGTPLVVKRAIQAHRSVGSAGLFEDGVGGQRAGAGGVMELEYVRRPP